jgi:hypothetical protein
MTGWLGDPSRMPNRRNFRSRHPAENTSCLHIDGLLSLRATFLDPVAARRDCRRSRSTAHNVVVVARTIHLRYAGKCSECEATLPIGTRAWWDAETRTTACPACRSSTDSARTAQDADASATASGRPDRPLPIVTGEAGASARREYENRHARREQRIEQRWGRMAGVVKFLSDDPQSTKAWAKGSEGEQRLAARLTELVGDRAVLLHDRKVPRTRGNIDHVAVAASGVWVIDTKNYKGQVEQRDIGRWFKTDNRLYVGGRDRTRIVDGLGWQVAAVRAALGETDVPVRAALCFVAAEWKLFAKPFQQDGVWVIWVKKLAELVAAPGPLTTEVVANIAQRLATALPAASTT